jgi:hypothetical protein
VLVVASACGCSGVKYLAGNGVHLGVEVDWCPEEGRGPACSCIARRSLESDAGRFIEAESPLVNEPCCLYSLVQELVELKPVDSPARAGALASRAGLGPGLTGDVRPVEAELGAPSDFV